MVGIVAAQVCAQQNSESTANSADSSSFINKAYNDFIDTKKANKVSAYWYIGSVLGGAGAASLVAASHFDGLAATHRNKAAIIREDILQSRSQEYGAYDAERAEMITWKDRRDFTWKLGLGLGIVGGSFMAYDLFVARDQLAVQVTPNSIQLATRF